MSLKINLLICFFILHLWAATGHKIGIYEIKKGDFSVKVTSYGARIISVLLPDKNGKIGDIVLGYDTIGEYVLINKCKDIGGVHKLKAERACHRHSKVSKLLELTMPSKINLLICLFILHLWAAVSVTEQKIGVYEIKKGDFSVKITNYGARIISVFLPDKHGVIGDVVLGYDTTEEYKNDTTSFGALLGRVANRIGGAQFTLNGTLYKLVANDGTNTLHGGINGFSRVVWNVSKYQQDGPYPHITLTYHSVDGEEGFPGDLLVSVTYALKDPYKLSVVMKAEALNKATPVNLAQHSYWNLGGHNSGDILSNVVQIFASHITPVDQSLIPTGKISPIKNTPYDFLKPREVGSQIKELQSGYDINYVLDSTEKMKPVAIVYDEKSGRVMDVQASAPGVQFYTANSLNQKGKGGYVYQPHAALCFETQGFPDAVNHPNFPSTIVTPGKAYIHKMLYTFSIMKYLNSY